MLYVAIILKCLSLTHQYCNLQHALHGFHTFSPPQPMAFTVTLLPAGHCPGSTMYGQVYCTCVGSAHCMYNIADAYIHTYIHTQHVWYMYMHVNIYLQLLKVS